MPIHVSDKESIRLNKLRNLFLSQHDDHVTLAEIAEEHKITLDDVTVLIDAGRAAHDSIMRCINDDAFEVKYIRMGSRMHNYQAFYNGKQFAYATSMDIADAACAIYHINRLTDLL